MKIQFGSIIVRGAGKINGHCVRNFRGTPILGRLPIPNKSNAFLSNPTKNKTIDAFKFYSSENLDNRNRWDAAALTIQFPDRFGNLRYLSGKNFASKCFLNCVLAGLDAPEVTLFSNTKPTLFCDNVIISTSTGRFDLVGLASDIGISYILYLKKNMNEIQNYNEKQLKIAVSGKIDILDGNQLFELIRDQNIVLVIGEIWSVGVRSVSLSGIVSPMQIFKTIVQ